MKKIRFTPIYNGFLSSDSLFRANHINLIQKELDIHVQSNEN